MTGICAAFRCGLVFYAIGALSLATLLFAAAPADAGLLRNAPGVGPVALAHRSMKKNLVGGLTGALDRAFRGALQDDSGEVDGAFDDALHAVGKTARDMIPGAWLLDTAGKRLKTAVENVRGFFGDARAALDPFGQAEAEVLDGGPLVRPEIHPPPFRGAGRSAGGDAWAEVMNERAGAATPTGGGSERPVESDVRAGNGAREEAGNEQAASDRGGDALAQRAEERRAPPPRDGDPSSGTWSCEEAGPLVEQATKEAEDRKRGPLATSAATHYCVAANSLRAILWGMIQCLNDPNLGASMGASAADRAGARQALRRDIPKVRQQIAPILEAFRAVTDGDVVCNCWSSICAD